MPRQPVDRILDIGLRLHVRQWEPDPNTGVRFAPFLLVHGLASNAQLWDDTAAALVARGHPVVAVDQRGHGLSDKPADGYDFATVSADLRRLIDALGWKRPVMAGQSWGGNVMLDFGARYPGVARLFVYVDGGFLNLRTRSDEFDLLWEELAPPRLAGLPLEQMRRGMKRNHPDWSPAAIAGALANFEHLPDGTIRPWLTRDRHRQILYALWQQEPLQLYPRVQEPVLICVAEDGSPWTESKRRQAATAAELLPRSRTVHFEHTHHDIHAHRPQELTRAMLDALRDLTTPP